MNALVSSQKNALAPSYDSWNFYDYEAAKKAGYGPDETGHWPSEYKNDFHPRRFIMQDYKLFDTKKGSYDVDMDFYNKWMDYWLKRRDMNLIDEEGDKPFFLESQ